MPKSTLQNLLKNWIDAGEHFEQGLISESVFLRAQAGAMETASRLKPVDANDAAIQLMFVVLIWKEETGEASTPSHIAMDKMLGHVVDFLQEDESLEPYQTAYKRIENADNRKEKLPLKT